MSEPRKYETLVKIGTGGMATVYVGRARGALGFSRLVAIKRAHPHVVDDRELRAAMRREAALVAHVHHPNVARVLDVDDSSGELELVLDYVEGCTLVDLLRTTTLAKGTPDVRAMLRIVLDAAAGLEAAHRARGEDGRLLGLVHRDVSPQNVLVGLDGIARLTDFGIAAARDREGDATATGVLKGKLGYMAPEYVEHYRADARSDAFSLGVVVWEALAGKRLFKAPTEIETLKKVLRAVVPPLGDERPELAPLDALLARALSRRPADRFASVADFAAELEAVARRSDLVGSHAEVGACVEAAVGDELRERRLRIAEASAGGMPSTPQAMATPGADRPSVRPRDDMATASVVVDRAQLVDRSSPGAAEGGTGSVHTSTTPPSPGREAAHEPEPTVVIAPALRARSRRGLVVGASVAGGIALVLMLGAVVLRSRGPLPLGEVGEVGEAGVSGMVSSSPSYAPSASPEAVLPVVRASSSESPLDLDSIATTSRPINGPSIAVSGKKSIKPTSSAPLVPKKAPPNPYAPKR